MAKVYLAMAGDILHQGHINIIREAERYGDVIVGLITDDLICNNKRFPFMSYEDRENVISNIKGVHQVVEQKTLDYEDNLRAITPDYVIHGDDWKTGPQSCIRTRVIQILKEWDGQLIEVPYTRGISSTIMNDILRDQGVTAGMRRRRLRELLQLKDIVSVMEAHNGLTGLIVEKTKVEHNGEQKEFDAMWISSLCDSTAKGKPDIELVDYTSRISTINEIIEVTSKPIILDGDTGGLIEHFVYNVKTLERLGVSAIIIEDKIGLKRNSLFGTDAEQEQDSIENFSQKILAGKQAQITGDFMVIARIESLILQKGIDDALTRAKAYIKAGCDGIMIHSKEKDGKEIIEFLRRYKEECPVHVPVIAVPTLYNHMTERDLYDHGCKIVIHANHLIRSAYPAMVEVAKTILKTGRSADVDDQCLSIKEILKLIPERYNG